MQSGIYKITNTENNDFYIGSSFNIHKRQVEHKRLLATNKHSCIKLQSAYNKYGIGKFEYSIIELCSRDVLRIREQYFLDTLLPAYNIAKSATAPMEGRKHNKETIIKLKKWKRASGIDHHLHGVGWTPEQREKLISSRLGKKRSIQFKQKQRDNNIKLNLSKFLIPSREKSKKKIIDSAGMIFDSVTETAVFHHISPSTVCDILAGRHSKTRNKVSFKYYV